MSKKAVFLVMTCNAMLLNYFAEVFGDDERNTRRVNCYVVFPNDHRFHWFVEEPSKVRFLMNEVLIS